MPYYVTVLRKQKTVIIPFYKVNITVNTQNGKEIIKKQSKIKANTLLIKIDINTYKGPNQTLCKTNITMIKNGLFHDY